MVKVLLNVPTSTKIYFNREVHVSFFLLSLQFIFMQLYYIERERRESRESVSL